MKPNDKPQKTSDEYEDPKLLVVVGGDAFPKPGLETAFVDFPDFYGTSDENKSDKEDDDKVYSAVVCSCNRVYVAESQRTLRKRHISDFDRIEQRKSSSSGGSSRGGCRCAPVS
jgi:hypothetical protein